MKEQPRAVCRAGGGGAELARTQRRKLLRRRSGLAALPAGSAGCVFSGDAKAAVSESCWKTASCASGCREPGGSGASSANCLAGPSGALSVVCDPEPAAAAGSCSAVFGPETGEAAVGGLSHHGSPSGLAGRSAAVAAEAATRQDPSTVMSSEGILALPCRGFR